MSRPELIFGLVGAAGTRLQALSTNFHDALAAFSYKTLDIRVSALLENFRPEATVPEGDESERIRFLQERGNAFRHRLVRGDAMALASIAAIREKRARITGHPDIPAT